MDGQIPPSVVRERYERLVAVADEVAWDSAKEQVGRVVDVLVAEGEGRKDDQTHRMSGRAADNRLVHFVAADARVGDIVAAPPRPGDMVSVEVTYAAPHHLVADVVHGVRRTRAGDAWEARQDAGPRPPVGVQLGMPAFPSGG
jgi:tRNA-2-methylthio-N6-dimethylallyladenosine synthase